MFPEKSSALLHLSNQWYHRVLEPVFDLLGLVAAWRLSLELRLALNPVMSLSFSRAEIVRLAPPLHVILLLWILVLPGFGMYRREQEQSIGTRLLRSARFALLASVLTVVGAFFFRHFGQDLSRSLVLVFAPVSLVTLLATRYVELFVCAAVDEVWPRRERLAVLGGGAAASRVVAVVRRAHGGARVEGIILPEGAAADLEEPVPVLGTTRQLAEVINRVQLDRIIVADDGLPPHEAEECARISRRMDVIVSRALGRTQGARLRISQFYGLDLLEIRPVAFTRGQEITKRAFDVAAAALLLAALSPFLAVLALLVKLSSPGPVFYLAKRVGKGGRHFPFLKFRSMRDGAHPRGHPAGANHKDGHIFKNKTDPRITPIGRWMRKYSLDELPQLVNVLRGDMSLVGPRPLPAEDLDPDGQSRVFARWSVERSRALPGITGLWQISGRSDTSFAEMTELDIDYIRNWSLSLDLKILLVTPLVVVTGRGAY